MSCAPLTYVALAVVALAAIWGAAPAAAGTVTFLGTGAEQSFTVPAGVSSVRVAATGSGGADRGANSGGRAAVVTATLAVAPGQVFYVEVGGIEGFGGGGEGGGGGASDVRGVSAAPPNMTLSLASRILVAGGGGGAAALAGATGGDAGRAGGAASGSPECAGDPGTFTAGGDGGKFGGDPGTAGSGGDGFDDGGGGGGGLFGGGSSGSTSGPPAKACGGGGGGSSLVPKGGTLAMAPSSGTPAQVTFAWDDPPPLAPVTPVPPDVVLPELSELTISPAAFRAKGAVASAAVGSNIRYRLSEAATVALSVERVVVGHRRGKRCLAGSGQSKRCTLLRKVRGGIPASGAAGLNRVRFNGRLRGKALAPGRYRLVAVATDAAGNSSSPVSRPFRIVAPPAR